MVSKLCASSPQQVFANNRKTEVPQSKAPLEFMALLSYSGSPIHMENVLKEKEVTVIFAVASHHAVKKDGSSNIMQHGLSV